MANTPQKSTPSPEARKPVSTARGMNPLEDVEQLFDRFFGGPRRSMLAEFPLWDAVLASAPSRPPKVDVVDREKEILVRAELPGIERKDLDVSVNEHTVTVKGQSRRESEDEDSDYYRREIAQGSFTRTVALPGAVDADSASAKFSDGILELTLPKRKESHRRRVEVK
ncbi:Hsp20/alpha crystallin family protein [Aquisalimonas sp.]|uniref:Hsp20/alpha crystallin family protein n=1 Tax=Aquisalimonas sp. TaxID=1872621 RepID=UPI0025BE5EEC|nr:Hsp20/alpha crystallin family protein [Aquisalimonas sp.]